MKVLYSGNYDSPIGAQESPNHDAVLSLRCLELTLKYSYSSFWSVVGDGSRGISEKDKKILGWRSGNRCALPDCRRELIIDRNETDSESIVGDFAHIKGERPGSARYDASMSDQERNAYANRILVCKVCHKRVDDQPNEYTVEKLLEIKKQHEHYIRTSTANGMIGVTFKELSAITGFLSSDSMPPSDSYSVVAPKQKIERNSFSATTERMITMGMTQVRQVSSFVDHFPEDDLGERLKHIFLVEYERLRDEEHLTGDDLFDHLLESVSKNSSSFKERAAALAVLVYLFEKCEVFER